jgi:hypothetical protein
MTYEILEYFPSTSMVFYFAVVVGVEEISRKLLNDMIKDNDNLYIDDFFTEEISTERDVSV